MRYFPKKYKKTHQKFLKQLTVKLSQQIIVLTYIFEMRHQTTNFINNFLSSSIAQMKKRSVGKRHSKMQTAGATEHCRALLETYYMFIVARFLLFFHSFSFVDFVGLWEHLPALFPFLIFCLILSALTPARDWHYAVPGFNSHWGLQFFHMNSRQSRISMKWLIIYIVSQC